MNDCNATAIHDAPKTHSLEDAPAWAGAIRINVAAMTTGYRFEYFWLLVLFITL